MSKISTIYTRINAQTGKSEFRNTLHKRGKFGWKPIQIEWVECVFDFCGNDRDPGASADLWQVVGTGRKLVFLQGGWRSYLGRFYSKVTVPYAFFLDEYPKVSFEESSDVIKWMRTNFVKGAKERPSIFLMSSPSTKPNPMEGVPFIGRSNSITAWAPSREQMRSLHVHLERINGGFRTLDGSWAFAEDARLRYSGMQYIVYRDDKAWFVTAQYNLVLRSLMRHVAAREVRLKRAA